MGAIYGTAGRSLAHELSWADSRATKPRRTATSDFRITIRVTWFFQEIRAVLQQHEVGPVGTRRKKASRAGQRSLATIEWSPPAVNH